MCAPSFSVLLAEQNSQCDWIYFQFCLLCGEFRKIGLLQNILQYIYTILFAFLVFIFHVLEAHALFH